ncbi:MAG: GNAT family N-acetyltransferase [Candidatus Thiodiazotropha sp.]
MTTTPDTASQLAIALQQTARQYRHRRLLLFCGEPAACRQQAHQVATALAPSHVLWVGEEAPAQIESVRNPQARERLGSELDLLVYDAFCGFDPDAFGALGGTVRGGGLLMLLAPPLERWHDYPDPERQRIVVAGYRPEQVSGNFLRRLGQMLANDPWVVRIDCGQALPTPRTPIGSPAAHALQSGDCLTRDQQLAVEAILRVVKGHRRRPLVISSDRGRGKSSAMGIAAARLLREKPCRLLVTAPRRSAVDALFTQAERLLPGVESTQGELRYGGGSLAYSAPDHLLAEPRQGDLLLVDEAAAIPTALLQALLEHYPRIVFATTLHGYEGTGRGFALRFRNHLDQQTPQWRELRLETPVRWADDDPLEPLLFRLLGLDASPADDAEVRSATADNVETLQPGTSRLAANESLLRQLFGLLVLAHYRTTPLDFRLLLDAPNLRTLLLCHQDRVVGVALLSSEGQFDADLAQQIWAGTRRPKGHLMAQSLAAHVGIASAPSQKGLRIVRLAIHPAVQRRGLGSLLLDRIFAYAQEAGYDYLGTSFGVSEALFDFWSRNRLAPVRLGLRTGTSSGDHSVLMIAPLSHPGAALAQQAGKRFARQLPALLEDPLRDLEAGISCRLLAVSGAGDALTLDQDDWSDLAGFAFAHRGYETSLSAIEKLGLKGVCDSELSRPERELLVWRVLQKRPWDACARLSGLSGRAALEERLRAIMARLFRQFADAPARTLIPWDDPSAERPHSA